MSSNHLAIWGERLSQLTKSASHDVPVAASPSATPAAAETFDMITLDEAAKRMGVSTKTFRKWPVPRFKRGKVVRVRKSDLEDFIAHNSAAGDDVPAEKNHGQCRE